MNLHYHHPRVIYHYDLPIRIISAIAASHFLMFYNGDISYFEVVFTRDYVFSLLENFIVAFLLFSVVHIATEVLDRYFNWYHDLVKRLALQFCFGIVLPILLAVECARLLYAVNGVDINQSDYFPLAFPLIKIMLVLANVYYLLYFIYIKMKNGRFHVENFQPIGRMDQALLDLKSVVPDLQKQYKSSENDADKKEYITLQLGVDRTYTIHVRNEVAYFIRKNNKSWFKSQDEGSSLILIKDSLKKVESLCKDYQFLYRINKSTIVNYKVIKQIESIKEKRLLLVILKDEYTGAKRNRISYFSVNRNNAPLFRKWMDEQGQENKVPFL